MFKNIILIVVASFAFDFIFGSFLIKRPELFAKIQSKVPRTSARHFYKLIFVIIVAIITVVLKKYINLNDAITAIIVGFAISLSSVLFKIPRDEIKK